MNEEQAKKYNPMTNSYMFVGMTNGKIFFFKKRHQDFKSLLDSKETEKITLDQTNAHKVSETFNISVTEFNFIQGDVRKLIYTRIEGLDVLISGSADRSIKLWEPMNAKTAGKCF